MGVIRKLVLRELQAGFDDLPQAFSLAGRALAARSGSRKTHTYLFHTLLLDDRPG